MHVLIYQNRLQTVYMHALIYQSRVTSNCVHACPHISINTDFKLCTCMPSYINSDFRLCTCMPSYVAIYLSVHAHPPTLPFTSVYMHTLPRCHLPQCTCMPSYISRATGKQHMFWAKILTLLSGFYPNRNTGSSQESRQMVVRIEQSQRSHCRYESSPNRYQKCHLILTCHVMSY